MVIRLRKDMGLSHREIFASISTLAKEMSCRISDIGATVEYDSGEIRIVLGSECERKLGLLTLPRTSVSLEFHNLSKLQRGQFLERFNIAFRRGGG